MRFRFTETLSGGASPLGACGAVEPFSLTLQMSGRGLRECALGAPLSVTGELRAGEGPASPERLLPERAEVTGTLRLLVPAGLFYDLRVAVVGAPARDRLELRGARRFVRGDLFASTTTFDGVLVQGGKRVADVRLRFDARDDVPRLLRSLRLGGS